MCGWATGGNIGMEPIRIFVGCAANNEDLESQAVLEWSIKKYATRPYQITWMQLSRNPKSPFHGWDTKRWATPFTGFRWAIPELCKFKGKAIYTDSDVMFFSDIAELWDQEFEPGKVIMTGRKDGRICVSMWNCEAARKYILPIAQLKADDDAHQKMCRLIRDNPILVQTWRGNWNCLDRDFQSLGFCNALHYTDMRSQPQLRYALPRLKAEGQKHWFDGKLNLDKYPAINLRFDTLLLDAKIHGIVPEQYRVEPYGEFKKRSFAR